MSSPLKTIVETSAAITATASRTRKIALLAECLARLPPAETAIGVSYLSGTLPQGRIGLGPAIVNSLRGGPAAERPELDLDATDRAFRAIAESRGKGSRARREAALAGLFARATPTEQDFLSRLVLGELRQGALEGIMVKDLDASYEAGSRGAAWRKIKRVHTLDLVVLAAEWGSGRRQGFLSNLHPGARDAAAGGLVMLGKTFKGLTDELLAWQTEQFLTRASAREGEIVHVRPFRFARLKSCRSPQSDRTAVAATLGGDRTVEPIGTALQPVAATQIR